MPAEGWIAYVTNIGFPWGTAGSRRIYGNSRSLVDAGYNVVVACGDDSPEDYTLVDVATSVDRFSYIGLDEKPSGDLSIIKKAFQIYFANGKKTMAWLDGLESKPSHVIVYGGFAPYLLRLLPWCRKNNVSLIADVVEWYEVSHNLFGWLHPFSISASLSLSIFYKKCNGIISISKYLQEYYENCVGTVVRIPPSLDVDSLVVAPVNNNSSKRRLRLIYAGTPGNKDLLSAIIRGVSEVDPSGELLELKILGVNFHQLADFQKTEKIPSSVQFLGILPQVEVKDHLQKADFSVLLREPLRFAQAGFSTKFVESLANGVPVIANITGDMGDYLTDGVEGIVCESHTQESFKTALIKAVNLTNENLVQMKASARVQAERSFDFRGYIDTMKYLIEKTRI